MKNLNAPAKAEESIAEKKFRIKRQKELQKIRSERDRVFKDEKVKFDREQMMEHVSSIIYKHIFAAELLIPKPTEGAALFNESNQVSQEWTIQSTSGYSSTLPLFIYSYEKVNRPV